MRGKGPDRGKRAKVLESAKRYGQLLEREGQMTEKGVSDREKGR
jgi:hypothetical protein